MSNEYDEYVDPATEKLNLPNVFPPSILDRPEAPILDWNSINDFRKFWKDKGANPDTLEKLLKGFSVVTPELHSQTRENILNRIDDFTAQNEDQTLNVITSGGRSGREMNSWLLDENDPRLKVLISKGRVNLASLELSSDVGTEYVRYEDPNVFRTATPSFLYIDDWILGGQQVSERLGPIYKQNPNSKFVVAVGGITEHGAMRLEKQYGKSVLLKPTFTVPTAIDVLGKDVYEEIKREIYNIEGYSSDFSNSPMTLEWRRVPDNIPSIFTSMGGLNDPKTNESVYLFHM